MLILEDCNIGIVSEVFFIVLMSLSLNPVVPITTGLFFSLAIKTFSNVDLGVVKSIITSDSSNIFLGLSDTI